jgi:shikimate dehydrogenase
MKAAVLGSPVSHSLSPVLHRAAYNALDLTHTYEAIEVPETSLIDFVNGLDANWLGLSLTMPLKEVAFELSPACDELAIKTGAINTLVFSDVLRGYNTDVLGIVDAVREAGHETIATATIFGSGATARSALVALSELGANEVSVVARNEIDIARMVELGKHLNLDVQPCALEKTNWMETDLVINTTPAGALDEIAQQVFRPQGLLLDVVYDPWPTQLAACWSVTGGQILSGLSMLLHQAGHQVNLMTGEVAPLTKMRDALNSELLTRGLSTI